MKMYGEHEYMYVMVCSYACMYEYVFMNMYKCMDICLYKNICICIHMCIRMYIRMYVCVRVCVCLYVNALLCGCLLMHVRYRVAKMHRMPHLCRSFSAEEPYNQWLFCGNSLAT